MSDDDIFVIILKRVIYESTDMLFEAVAAAAWSMCNVRGSDHRLDRTSASELHAERRRVRFGGSRDGCGLEAVGMDAVWRLYEWICGLEAVGMDAVWRL